MNQNLEEQLQIMNQLRKFRRLASAQNGLSSHIGCFVYSLHLVCNDIIKRFEQHLEEVSNLLSSIKNSKLGGEVRIHIDPSKNIVQCHDCDFSLFSNQYFYSSCSCSCHPCYGHNQIFVFK